MYCDNSSSIKLSTNPVMHVRCKHIDVRFHFLEDLTKDGVIELMHYSSQDQVTYIMLKPLKLKTLLKAGMSIRVEIKFILGTVV